MANFLEMNHATDQNVYRAFPILGMKIYKGRIMNEKNG